MPSTIMLALSGVWTVQLVSIVAAIVCCCGVAIAIHSDLAIFGTIKLRTGNCKKN